MADPRRAQQQNDVNRVFFRTLLALNIAFFLAICVFEYRAFKIASLRGFEVGLEVDFDRPDSPAQLEHWQTAIRLARDDYIEGREAFRKCALCHGLGDSDAKNFGPNLTCVVNRSIADAEGLKAEELIATAGVHYLEEGQSVTIQMRSGEAR